MTSRLLLPVSACMLACVLACAANSMPGPECPEGTIRVQDVCVATFSSHRSQSEPLRNEVTHPDVHKPLRAKRMIGMFPNRHSGIYCPHNHYLLPNGDCVQTIPRPQPQEYPADYVDMLLN